MSVVWAETGEAALSNKEIAAVDLIITDWLLPDMEGGQIIRALREKFKEATPPVLVVSAFSTSDKKQEFLSSGASAFINKPIDPLKLISVLDSLGFKTPAERRSIKFAPSKGFAHELLADGVSLSDSLATDRTLVISLVSKIKKSFLSLEATDSIQLVSVLERALVEDWSEEDVHRLISRSVADIRRIAKQIIERDIPGSPIATSVAVLPPADGQNLPAPV